MKCRHCAAELVHTLIDLGKAPPSNSLLTKKTIGKPENYYPLKVLICDSCWLVQTEDFVGRGELFSADYAYFSSFSSSWLEHAKNYVEKMTKLLNLTTDSIVVEVAANDGYLLQYVREKGIPCYGIEPTKSTAQAARDKNIEIIEEFFSSEISRELVEQGRQADLIVANNVLAHVPDINDFVKGVSMLLKPDGVATFEFPHVLNMVEQTQFDTIYHEHYSYLSLITVQNVFNACGLKVFDVEQLPSHGGSLRIYAERADTGNHLVSETLYSLQEKEHKAGISNIEFYLGFQEKAEDIKKNFLSFLIDMQEKGKNIVAYGAAAKGNSMMNFAGVRQNLIPYVVDQNPAKQGKYMPGSHVPIINESALKVDKPDYVLIFPWNLKIEVMSQLAYIRVWGGQFVTVIPNLLVE